MSTTEVDARRLHEAFDYWCGHAPERPFLYLHDDTLSYAAVAALVDRAAHELQQDGVRAGDRVLIVAENCPQHVALILACSRIGAWSCGVNARMAPGEVAAFADKADARIIYFTTAVSEAASEHARRFAARPSAIQGLERSPIRAQAVAETGPEAEGIAAIIFTSGTTGTPKGVLVTHRGLLHFARTSSESRRLGPDDRVYAYVPMTHIFGLGTVLAAALYAGAGLVMRTKFSPADVLDALAHHGVSNLQGPPTLFARLLAYMDSEGITRPACPHLKYLYTGAGPLSPELKQVVEERFGQPLFHGYGLSEYAGSPYVTSIDSPRSDTSAGYAVEGAEVRIVDDEGKPLPAGERGEIWIRGVGLTPGYFRDLEATRQAMKPGGWYASGDIGYLAPDGALFVVGRLKEMIIRSGFNVYPAEVEAVLNAFPAIHHAAVVGRGEADGNEEILAFVEPRPGMKIDRTALREYLQERLAPYKRPSRIIELDTLPMTASGKVLKRLLLEKYSDR
ncbi:MAG TPA: class I adenylate-forming enzyme family protein [Burkholderiaceae bacterium]|nr:class I adenylate-forming enzyme family protein [Burkholderiaceae bacterium]